MVIIIEDNAPALQWSLGVVTKIFMGDDQLVRVVDVRTSRGILRRPIHKPVSYTHLDVYKRQGYGVGNTVSFS